MKEIETPTQPDWISEFRKKFYFDNIFGENSTTQRQLEDFIQKVADTSRNEGIGYVMEHKEDLKVVQEAVDTFRKRVIDFIEQENWHAICGANGMCECGSEKGVCKMRLIEKVKELSPSQEVRR